MEIRRHKRFAAKVPVEVRLSGWDEYVKLYTQDISIGGLFIASDNPAEVFSTITVRIVLPEEAGELNLEAQVVHVVSPEQAQALGRLPGMGVQFCDVSDADKEKMAQLLDAVRAGEAACMAATMAQDDQTSSEHAEISEVLQKRLDEIERRAPVDVFGLARDADVTELRQVFLRLANRFHPQRFAQYNDRAVSRVAQRVFAALESAYCSAKEELATSPRQAAVPPSDGPEPNKPVLAEVKGRISAGLRHLAQKRYQEAIAALQAGARLDPYSSEAQIWLRVARARAAVANNDPAEAVAQYQEILDEFDDAHHEAVAGVRRHGSLRSRLAAAVRKRRK